MQQYIMSAYNIDDIAKSLYVVNVHAKSAMNQQQLYNLKNRVIKKLLKEGRAKKEGIHIFKDKTPFPTAAVSVRIGKFSFHTPPTSKDLKTLLYLGGLDNNYHNPKVRGIYLIQAIETLYNFLGNRVQENLGLKRVKPSCMISEYLSME